MGKLTVWASRKHNTASVSEAEAQAKEQAQTYVEKRNALQTTHQPLLTEEQETARAQVLSWLERKRKNWQRKK